MNKYRVPEEGITSRTEMRSAEAIGLLMDIYGVVSEEYKIAIDKAVDALEKQIPQKPVDDNTKWVSWFASKRCPRCGELIKWIDVGSEGYDDGIVTQLGCCKCGQKIDWSEEDREGE